MLPVFVVFWLQPQFGHHFEHDVLCTVGEDHGLHTGVEDHLIALFLAHFLDGCIHFVQDGILESLALLEDQLLTCLFKPLQSRLLLL